MKPDPLIELREVSKIYRRDRFEVRALNRVNLQIARGEFAVVLGPSGCGKSTMLNLIGGLDTPTTGSVIVDGEDISHYNEAQLSAYRRHKIGFVFQFFNLVPTLTARENIELAAELVANPRPIDELLHAVGLYERANHFPGELSGGEQQRVAIARALVTRPPILLCDEPTGELDSATGKRILQLLRALNRQEGQTIVLVTHNSAIVAIADHVIRLRDGQIESEIYPPQPAEVESLEW
ncbi:MAG: ABC transporter ATP-binding protein [Armatimonadetes bacterium]|jgi:putative ABC transport system ATP-binding protein|nr:ABC transporter ATP-binding protein [Armatimonadota bacterium]